VNYCSCWLSKLVSLSLSIAFFLICVSFVGKPANRFYGLAKVLPKFSAAATDYGHDSGNRLSGWAWAGDGCSTAGTAHKWTELDTSLSASVRCCSVGGIEVTCDSDPSGTCLPAVATYAEAEQACAAAGMRLCTRGEIEDDICCGTGCGYDGHVVWTSEPEYLMCSHIFSMHDADWVMGSRASSDEFAFENVDVTPPEQLAPFDSSGHDSGNRLSRGAWAGDGCSTAGTAHKWTELNTSLSASVRCCSVGVSGIEVTCDSNPSGTCLPAVATYAEAEQACAAAGMRLCTRGEIEDDICCGTGCGYDGHVVWTSSGSQGLSLSLSLCVSSCCVWHTHSCAYAFVCVGSNVFSSLYVCVYVCPLIKCAAHLRVANGERVATHHASIGSWH